MIPYTVGSLVSGAVGVGFALNNGEGWPAVVGLIAGAVVFVVGIFASRKQE